MKKSHELATEVMNILLNDDLNQVMIRATPEEGLRNLQIITEGLTMVQARLTASYLMKLAGTGMEPLEVANLADEIIGLISTHLDQCVSSELGNAVEILQDMVDSKNQTSH